jgi:GT2 family glycosyltransferase
VIAVVVLTHNRAHLLAQCIDNVLSRTCELTTEIVIWDNASTDRTADVLAAVDDPRIRVVRHDRNIGQSAYHDAFMLTSAEYLLELDDDMIEAPDRFDETLLDAFRRLPEVGFLASDLVDDPHDEAAAARYGVDADKYSEVEVNGVRLLAGPTGGGCAITSRVLYDRVGGFRRQKGGFFLEDAAYIADIAKLGYGAYKLADLRLHHAGGAYYSQPSPERQAYWARYWRAQARKAAVKRALLRVPLVRPLNERLGLFTPPAAAPRR